MKIKVHVHTIKSAGTTSRAISKKDMRMIKKLMESKRKFEIEYIYDKFLVT